MLNKEDFVFEGKCEIDSEELKNVAGGDTHSSTCHSNRDNFICAMKALLNIWD